MSQLSFFEKTGPLVIVPCSGHKIWREKPNAGPTPARRAYVSAPFGNCRKYAEEMGSAWMILSAKYGFTDPDTEIENYEASFVNGTQTVTLVTLQDQAKEIAQHHKKITCLGSSVYADIVAKSFVALDVEIWYPVAGKDFHQAVTWMHRQITPEPPGGFRQPKRREKGFWKRDAK